jgi:hypothetical protein
MCARADNFVASHILWCGAPAAVLHALVVIVVVFYSKDTAERCEL